MPLPNMTPAQLLAGAQVVAGRVPDAELVKNLVGNLAIVRDGEQVGWLDLRYGIAHFDEDGELCRCRTSLTATKRSSAGARRWASGSRTARLRRA